MKDKDQTAEKPKPLSSHKPSYQDFESLNTTRSSSSSSGGVFKPERAKTSIDSPVFEDLNNLSLSFQSSNKKSAPVASDKMYKSRETRRS